MDFQILYEHSEGRSEQKPVKTVENSNRGRSQGVPKIFMANMYMAHCAVIFAIAQLSCLHLYLLFYGRGLGTVMQADYMIFVFKFPTFRYRGNRGWSEANYIALHCYIR